MNFPKIALFTSEKRQIKGGVTVIQVYRVPCCPQFYADRLVKIQTTLSFQEGPCGNVCGYPLRRKVFCNFDSSKLFGLPRYQFIPQSYMQPRVFHHWIAELCIRQKTAWCWVSLYGTYSSYREKIKTSSKSLPQAPIYVLISISLFLLNRKAHQQLLLTPKRQGCSNFQFTIKRIYHSKNKSKSAWIQHPPLSSKATSRSCSEVVTAPRDTQGRRHMGSTWVFCS